MIGPLRPAPPTTPLPTDRVDPAYRRLRRQVFAGIFLGYAAYYLVRKNFALAIPDILREHPEYSKAALGSAMTGLSIAYGVSKFLMGSISDRSNPRYFLPLGLLLSCTLTATCGLVPALYSSLALIIALQTLNGWVQGMGWPPCGKTMVHWFSTRERGLTVSVWNIAHNIGGAVVANLALLGVTLFHDWGAKFYFNALVAALVAIGFLIYGPIMLVGLHALDLVPKKAAGTAAGFTGFFGYVFGSAIAGSGVGWIADRFGWNGVFMTMIACCVLAMAFSALTLRHQATSSQRASPSPPSTPAP